MNSGVSYSSVVHTRLEYINRISQGDADLFADTPHVGQVQANSCPVNGQLKTEILKRSIYEVNVYQSELTLKGSFSSEELKKSRMDMEQLQFDRAAICLNLTDMRGISEQISITLGDSVSIFEPGMDNRGIDTSFQDFSLQLPVDHKLVRKKYQVFDGNLLLMIPMFMIENLISERGRTQEEAIDEVSEKVSGDRKSVV